MGVAFLTAYELIFPPYGKLKKGETVTAEYLQGIGRYDWFDIRLSDEATALQLEQLKDSLGQARVDFDSKFEEKKRKLTQGDELPPGVQKMVKVYLAVKRRLQPGDKMAGRHGNKGVIARILPEEDMPYLPDGTPVDTTINISIRVKPPCGDCLARMDAPIVGPVRRAIRSYKL